MIKRVQISTISVSGKMNEAMKEKIAKVLQAAGEHEGKILRRQDFSDGIFLEVLFEDEKAKQLWGKAIGLKITATKGG